MWLTLDECSVLLGITTRDVRYRISKNYYTFRKLASGHGGKGFRYEIALESLPAEIQQRYWAKVQQAQAIEASKPRRGRPTKAAKQAQAKAQAIEEAEIQANQAYVEAPRWQKDTVDRRLQIVCETLSLGRRELAQWLEARALDVSVPTIYRWRKAYLAGGKNALMAGYGTSKGQSIIPDDVFGVFLSVYMTEGRVSTQAAYIAALGYLSEHYQCVKQPSLGAFEYRLKRDHDESTRYLARHGESAWNRKYGRSITRDYSKIRAGECAVGDHMQLDLLVTLEDGTTCRPWLTAWTDFKSRKLLGWSIHAEAPNSDHIFESFRIMVKNFGLPKSIYIDNGKDYRCRDFAGGRVKVTVDETHTSSLMVDLGVEVNFAIPYNAQAKNIERRFRDLHNYCERMMSGYTGTNVVKRPEILKKQIKTGKILTFVEAYELVNKFIVEVLNRMPFGRGAIFANLCPDEIWANDNPTMRRASAESLAVFCQRCSRTITVGRNGVKDPDLGVTYWAEEFVAMKGRKVYLRRDIHDYTEAWVYGIDDVLLCRARLAEAVHPLANDEISHAELKARMAEKRRECRAVKKATETAEIAAADKMTLLQAGVAAINSRRGWEPKPQGNVIEIQHTPLDERVREMDEIRREATTNTPVYPVLPSKPERKIYLSRAEMLLDIYRR